MRAASSRPRTLLRSKRFFRTEELVCVHFNPAMRQNELYAGAKRLNSKHAIDYAFLRDNDEYSEKRLRRAHAVEKARNLVHWDGSARASWLKENAYCSISPLAKLSVLFIKLPLFRSLEVGRKFT